MRLSIGTSRTDKVWKQVDWTWPRFIEEARRHRTVGTETHAEYMAMPRSKQDLLKDNGGFVAAALADSGTPQARLLPDAQHGNPGYR